MTLTFRIMVLLLAATVFAQGPELRISADEAAKHLLTSRRPDYLATGRCSEDSGDHGT
jgi:hypothetical protein